MPGKKTWVAGLALLMSASAIVVSLWVTRPKESPPGDVAGIAGPARQEQTQAPTTPAPQVAAWAATYENERFGYVVAYPASLLKAGQEADNRDGLTFVPNTGDADVRVWGEYNVNDDSPTRILQFDLANDCAQGKVSYQVAKPNLVAFSCFSPRGRIVYAKTIFRDDTLATMRFEYDPREQETWSPVIGQMANSLSLWSGPANGAAR